MKKLTLFVSIVALAGLAACQAESQSPTPPITAVADNPQRKPSPLVFQSPGKPTAPVNMRYEVVGNPVVGSPVLINVEITSASEPVAVSYSINDQSALLFQDGQVERLEIADPSAGGRQQLSVIPQREGRVFVNVSAEVQTPGGSMIRAMAIPIKVGSQPEARTINGELREGPGGETVISMPATEAN